MDTKESKTPEEQKQHMINERIPEDFETSQPHLQPEAKQRPDGLYKLLPLVVIIVGAIVLGIIVLGIISRGN